MVDEFAIEGAFAHLGLEFQRIELKTRPHAIHWHARKVGWAGTLEATLESGIVTFEVRSNRRGEWTDMALSHLNSEFQPQK